MTEVLLYHHAQGLTPGVLAFAQALRDAGHVVYTPDLYEGQTFDTLDDGVGYAKKTGFDTLLERGELAAQDKPEALVYAGMSLGVMPAQKLAQNRPGARGALLLHGCIPPEEFGGAWPTGVPVQIHAMEADPFMAEGDADAARALVASTSDAQFFEYPGDAHLFTDSSLPGYDEGATARVLQRALAFLDGVPA
jgi:dienelactone hydrolase